MLTSIVSDNMIIFVAKNPWYALVEVNKDNMGTVMEKLIYFQKNPTNLSKTTRNYSLVYTYSNVRFLSPKALHFDPYLIPLILLQSF